MNQNPPPHSYTPTAELADKSNLKSLFFKYLKFWPYFLVSILIAVVGAYFFNRYATPIYSINSTILLKDARGSSATAAASDFLGSFQPFKVSQNIQNEIGIMASRSMAELTLKKLNFGVSYYTDGNIKNSEIFENIPLAVEPDTNHLQLWSGLFEVEILNNHQFYIKLEKRTSIIKQLLSVLKSDDDAKSPFKQGIYTFGQDIEGVAYRFKINKTNYFDGRKRSIQFKLNTLDELVSSYAGRVRVNPINKTASLVTLTLDSHLPIKDIIYLNQFATTYIKNGLDEKNLIASNTINFIDAQLNGVTDSLSVVEDRLQRFQTSNRAIDLTIAGNQVFQKLSDLEDARGVQELKSKYYNYLLSYISKNRDFKDVVAPSGLGIEDEVTTNLIKQLIGLYAQRNEIEFSATEQNPYLPELDSKIQGLTKTLEENIRNAIKSVKIETDDITGRIKGSEAAMAQLPKKERDLVSIKRRFSLNENLYVYLLQKRAEAGISKASNLPDSRTIDRARVSAQIYPKTSSQYTYAIFLGILIPLGLIVLKEYFNNSITNREDLEKRTSIPILGQVAHNNKASNLVIANNPKSAVSETFRSLRSNLQYLAPEKENKIVLITSGVSGEGKSFCAINLSSVLALGGKKTLLIGVDLRKPKIFDDFGLSNEVGVSTYLIGKASKDDIIQKTHSHLLDIITAGPLSPNPTELLMTKRFTELIGDLKKEYEYIILDSPPLGLVADSFELLHYADVTLYVVRQNYTIWDSIVTINGLYSKGNIKNLALILNDFKLPLSYGYGYGYGYGYYEDDAKKSTWWRRILFTNRFTK